MNWIISANGNMYDHAASFEKRGYIDWRQTGNFKIGDIVYIYSTSPISRVQYKCIVEKVNMTFSEITDDKKFWKKKEEYYKSQDRLFSRLKLLKFVDREELSLNKLKDNGLKAAPQGPTRLINEREKVTEYIEQFFQEDQINIVYPNEINDENLYEGATKKVKVNRYERSSKAREKCIDYFGLNCVVCGFNFKEKYGEIGKGFIHVHHIKPLSEVDKNYKVNYKEDLIPVCPNCHAMLHTENQGKLISVKDLKEMININS